ncbi:hypothetical protein OG21DRAFT_1519769 [Imleria badia]|nr:hypothetical protein OG21DRAFT_1519769 [Imleria badia]
MNGHGHGHELDQLNDPPLLSPAIHHHGNVHPNTYPAAPPPNQANPSFPPNGFGFSFSLGNPNSNNNNDNDNDGPPGAGPPNPPNPDFNLDPSSPSLVSSFPPTLSILHLPQISPTGLKEVVDRCEGIQVLGIVIGNAFANTSAFPLPTSPKPSKTTGQSTARSKGGAARSGTRPEVSVLAGILSRARVLRELIIDTSPADIVGMGTSPGGTGMSSGGYALLTPVAVRMLMRESLLLRRIVGEGRVWESPTPTPSSPVPFPHCLDIDLTLSPARYGPGAGNHAHGPPGFGTHGGGYGQMEPGNDHWFWLTDSASRAKFYGWV